MFIVVGWCFQEKGVKAFSVGPALPATCPGRAIAAQCGGVDPDSRRAYLVARCAVCGDGGAVVPRHAHLFLRKPLIEV